MEILLDKILKNQTPADPHVVDPLTKVTAANADAFSENWKKWLGK